MWWILGAGILAIVYVIVDAIRWNVGVQARQRKYSQFSECPDCHLRAVDEGGCLHCEADNGHQ